MNTKYYKGYKIGSIEKGFLKLILNVKNHELPNKYDETFSDIFKTARQKSEYSNNVQRMVKKDLLKFVRRDQEIQISLTNKGKKLAQEYMIDDLLVQNKINSNWDGQWRIVMFDISENKKKTRDLIRFHLKRIGFVQIQGSVWIYPYPCEEIITIIKSHFNLDNEIIYLTTSSFSKDYKIKKIFKLL